MRTQRVVLWSSLLVGFAALLGYSSCGGTGGGVNPFEAFQQFVSQTCSPAGPNGGGNCLILSVPNAVPADGHTVSGFRAQLIDGSGHPLPGVQICFAFENPLVATIVEPTNSCGLTDGNGFISGQFRDGINTGSFALVATAPAGFGLQTRRTISFVASGNVTPGGSQGAPCGQPGDTPCASGLFCTANAGCFSSLPTCAAPGGAGACCSVDSECASGCNVDTGQCKPASGSVGVGGSCSSTADCRENLFCGIGGKCNAKLADGSACTFGDQCLSGTCNTLGTCGTLQPGSVGDPCNSTQDCKTGLFCGLGDGIGNADQCNARRANNATCTINDQCISNKCTNGLCTP